MSTFKDFKSKMKSSETQEKLKSSFEGKSFKDERYWTPQRDKQGNYNGVIRFLPAGNEEEKYYQEIIEYAFQNKKTDQWYIEKSLRTLGKSDPVAEANSELWNTGIEANKDIARKRKQNHKFIANIYVINDGANPENNGKVFLFKYGKAIQNKIHEAISPKFEDEQPINPYNPWDGGANFKLRIFKDQGTGLPSYDKCTFESPSALFDGDDEKIQTEIFDKLYPLLPEVDPSKFKTYDELKARFMLVEGITSKPTSNKNDDVNPDYVESQRVTETPKTVERPVLEDDDLPDELKALLADD